MNDIEKEIIANKELRRDLDAQIQKVKALPGSRERSITVTKLQEAVMWLGMDLKRINDANPVSTPPKTPEDCAREAYHRYGSVTDFKNFRGDPMPAWDALPPKIQEAWVAAATIPTENTPPGNPYPNSKDPSNTKIEPTTDGLKL